MLCDIMLCYVKLCDVIKFYVSDAVCDAILQNFILIMNFISGEKLSHTFFKFIFPLKYLNISIAYITKHKTIYKFICNFFSDLHVTNKLNVATKLAH